MKAIREDVHGPRRFLFAENIASPTDFRVGKPVHIDIELLSANNSKLVSPYCIDAEKRHVILVRQKDDSKLFNDPFFYSSQRNHAQAIYRVPFNDYIALCETLDTDFSSCKFIFSTGRCGSTLLAKMLDANPHIQSVSEPDIFTQIAMSTAISENDKKQLLYAATKHFLYYVQNNHQQSVYTVIKLRSQCIFIADIIEQIHADILSAYLYRDAVGFVNSWHSLIPGIIRAIPGLIQHSVLSIPLFRSYITGMCPVLETIPYKGQRIELVTLLTLFWLSNMETAQHLLETPNKTIFSCILTYRALKDTPTEALGEFCYLMNLPMPDSDKLSTVLESDAQANTHLQSKRTKTLDASDEQKIKAILALHQTITSTDFSLSQP